MVGGVGAYLLLLLVGDPEGDALVLSAGCGVAFAVGVLISHEGHAGRLGNGGGAALRPLSWHRRSPRLP